MPARNSPLSLNQRVIDLGNELRRLRAGMNASGSGLTVKAVWVGATTADTGVGTAIDLADDSMSYNASGFFTYNSSTTKVTVTNAGIYSVLATFGIQSISDSTVVELQVQTFGTTHVLVNGVGYAQAPPSVTLNSSEQVHLPPDLWDAGVSVRLTTSALFTHDITSTYLPAGGALLAIVYYG